MRDFPICTSCGWPADGNVTALPNESDSLSRLHEGMEGLVGLGGTQTKSPDAMRRLLQRHCSVSIFLLYLFTFMSRWIFFNSNQTKNWVLALFKLNWTRIQSNRIFDLKKLTETFSKKFLTRHFQKRECRVWSFQAFLYLFLKEPSFINLLICRLFLKLVLKCGKQQFF